MVTEGDGFSDKTVLVVDDTPISRVGTVALVEEMGFRVEQADGAEAALAMLRQGDYALVLMDYHMPGMDGIECARSIRASKDSIDPAVPIIALTSGGELDLESRCLEAGMNAFLLKTCSPETILQVLRSFI